MTTTACQKCHRTRWPAILGAASVVGAGLWWRHHPSACPYGQRFWLAPPHPLITRTRLREILSPQPGERILEVGPGTGHYSLSLAGWIAPDGELDILDIQQEMLDAAIRLAEREGLSNLSPTLADAQRLPFPDATFDALVVVTTLGEIPDQDTAMREFARVLKPGGRLVNGELFGDPHWVSSRAAGRRAAEAGLVFDRRVGPAAGYFARYERPLDAESA